MASGSGGINLALTFRLYMIAAGRGRRLQPPLLVNYNLAENNRIWAFLSPRGRRLFAILPRHIHRNPEGFGGNPTAWMDDEGLIRLDLEGMADRAFDHSRRIGNQPGVLVEFLVAGGGHGEIGLILHQALATARIFPAAFYLPICLIPDDVTQLAWLRVYTWHRYESCLAGLWGLLLDNAAKPQAVINDLLAIGLTDLDTCSHSDLTAGSLRQAVASLLNDVTHQYPAARNGFFRLAVIRRVLRSRRAWRLGIPFRQRKLIRSNTNDLEYDIRSAIKDCLETPAGLLDTNPLPTAGIPQVVCVSIPVKQDQLVVIVRAVKAILEREEWWQKHSATTNLLWGAINYPDPIVIDITKAVPATGWVTRTVRAAVWLLTLVPRLLRLVVFGRNHRQRELYATVTRLFPELHAYARVQHILNTDGIVPDGEAGTGWGFGSFEHLVTAPPAQNGHEVTTSAASERTPPKAAGQGRRRRPGFLNGTMATLLVCGGLALALIAGIGAPPSHGWTDTRQDVYQLTGQNARDADSVVALFPAAQVRDRGDGTSELLTVKYGAFYHLCPSERFWQQPSGSFCSGVLVAPDVIATAGHCIIGEDITTIRFVFGYWMSNATTAETVRNNSEIYHGVEVIAWHLDDSASDWALVRLDRPVGEHRIARIRESGTIRKGQAVHAIGYPLGLPSKFVRGTVKSDKHAAFFTSDIPTYPGNSGSPVFNSSSHQLEGILTRGKGGKPVKQGDCFVSRSNGGMATRAAAFAPALSKLPVGRNPKLPFRREVPSGTSPRTS
jgi:V8-like Glu-specific endopeptidase